MQEKSIDNRSLRLQTLQILCQFDAGNEDVALITDMPFDEDNSSTIEPHKSALTFATEIWNDRVVADKEIERLTPEWPIHRQPLIDRNILRLARYEMLIGKTPPKVAINEAVELARIFSTEKSSTFVNGVLDTLYHNTTDNQKSDDKAD